jgi:hypothetical protein
MSTDLVKSGHASIDLISGDNFERVERVATGLAQSGVFKDVTSTQNAMAKILLGADLGLTPTQALMNIDVVEGNARVRSNQLAAWVRQHPDYEYRVVEHDDTHCAIEFSYKGEPAGRSEFSIQDAEKAFLIKPDKPRQAWRAHPRNMLFARAMSNGVRWYCPDLTGGVSVYTEADSFESTAVEIGAGEGSGEAPSLGGPVGGADRGGRGGPGRGGGVRAPAGRRDDPDAAELAAAGGGRGVRAGHEGHAGRAQDGRRVVSDPWDYIDQLIEDAHEEECVLPREGS